VNKIIPFPVKDNKSRTSLDDVRKRALSNRRVSAHDFEQDVQSERNAEIWNREFEALWPSIYQTVE
jgi:hypothetical protein